METINKLFMVSILVAFGHTLKGRVQFQGNPRRFCCRENESTSQYVPCKPINQCSVTKLCDKPDQLWCYHKPRSLSYDTWL